MWLLYKDKKQGVAVYALDSAEAAEYGGRIALEVKAQDRRAVVGLSEHDSEALGRALVNADLLTPRRIKLEIKASGAPTDSQPDTPGKSKKRE